MSEYVEVIEIDVPRLGGKRENAGRKPKAFEDQVRKELEDAGEVEYTVSRARKEAWTAKTVELDYRIKEGEYVKREAVREACATAFASIAQTLRSIPDLLERREGVAPETCETVSKTIDDALNTLAEEFELFGG